MLCILWFHTEMYYVGRDVTPYEFYVGDVLAVFFFLSGYLFHITSNPFNVHHKLYGVWRWLIIPYLVFTTAMAVPKAMAHGNVSPNISTILTGHASWFISALIVAEIMFIAILYIGHKVRQVSASLTLAALAMLLASAIIGNRLSPYHNACNLWHVNESMLGFFLMTCGYFFHQYEKALDKVLRHPLTLLTMLILCVGIKYVIAHTGAKLIFGPIIVTNYYLFVADLLLVTFLLVSVFRMLPRTHFMQWVGRHSIVYYFFSGGVPLAVGKALTKLGFCISTQTNVYPCISMAFAIVCVLSTIMVWAVYRYTNIVR